MPDADVVIEAIFENLEAKQELYARLEPRMKPGALLATNTSSIMLEPLAAQARATRRAWSGLHFFNPVAQMPLIEIVHAAGTDAQAVQAATAFARKLDKLPVPCRSAPGFIVNRVLMPYLHEAMFAAQEGVPLAVIDRGGGATSACRWDRSSWPTSSDSTWPRTWARSSRASSGARRRRSARLRRAHRRQEARPQERRRLLRLAGRQAAQAAAPQRRRRADLIDRLILVLVNECVACLREKVVEDADLVDAAVIFGTGFAPFRGGPLTYARARGVPAVVARLHELAARHGAALPARCRLDAAHVMPGKCVTGSRCARTPVLPSKQALRRSMSGRAAARSHW